MKFALVIPSAGSGSRSGQSIPKQYVELIGASVLAHTLRAFAAVPACSEIVVAIDSEWATAAYRAAEGVAGVRFVPGGSERQHSIANALQEIGDGSPLVLVHDAARPCVSRRLIDRVVAAAAAHGAAIPGVAINETVKRVGADGRVLETIPRADLRAAQTPQGFRTELLRTAYALAHENRTLGTDDASLVEAAGATVHVVEGDPENIKITLPEDFERAERYLRRLNAGT